MMLLILHIHYLGILSKARKRTVLIDHIVTYISAFTVYNNTLAFVVYIKQI